MAKTSLAVLESALRERKLDRTLTSALPPLDRNGVYDEDACAPTGIAVIDACLRTGVPRGQLSELAGPSSSGRTTLLLQLMAAATQRGELAAIIDTFDHLDVESAEAVGIDLTRLLWVRGQTGAPLEWALDRALKALNLVLQAGGFGVVALDLADAPGAALRRLPFTTWLRVQRAVEGRDTACVLVTPEPLARSAGGLTLTLSSRTTWSRAPERPRITGADLRLRVVSPRRRVDGEAFVAAGFVAAGL